MISDRSLPWHAPDMSLSVVGGMHPNKDGSNRLFEMAMCLPGEPVQLVREPRNPIDPTAVAVFSARGLQLGYLSAERCGWIGARIAQGEDIRAVFHVCEQRCCRYTCQLHWRNAGSTCCAARSRGVVLR